MNPFDIINDLSYGKKYILEEESHYNPFITNKQFSLFFDTIGYSNEMNLSSHIDNKLQYDYYFHSIRKNKRFTKWPKKDKSDALESIQKYYGYTVPKAKEVLKILSKKQIQYIIKITNPE